MSFFFLLSSTDLKQNLQEIVKLRNELLRATILKENQIILAKNRNSSSTENLSSSSDNNNINNNNNSPPNTSSRRSRVDGGINANSVDTGSNSGSSSSSDWQRDSGIASQKSDSLSDSSSSASSSSATNPNSNSNQRAIIVNGNNQTKKSSSIPRPISMSVSSSSYSPNKNINPPASPSTTPQQYKMRSASVNSSSSKLADLTYKNFAREQLINLIQEIENENSIIKRQLENNKTPNKLTEIHNELASVREKLASSEKVNEYLRKQVEIYHITHGNVDILLEMGQKLNLTKDELEQYKEKLAKIQSISDSLPTNRRNQSFVAVNNNDAETSKLVYLNIDFLNV